MFLVFSLFMSVSQAQSELISMDFQDANLKDVLKVFSQQANLNFIASESVKDRKVTLYLDKVSVQDALNTLMSANNLAYEQKKDSKIFVVKELGKPEVETVTKIFPLQYAKVKGYELTEAGKQRKEEQTIGIREVIERLLSEHGRVTEDARTNSLVISDVPSQFAQIEKAIKELDVKLPQVMIEAEIIEATLETIDKLGIEWGSSAEGYLASAYGAMRTVRYPFTKDGDNPKIGTDGNPTNIYLGYLSAANLGGTLAMLTKDSDTKILARPRILTLNNQTAEINITSQTAVASLATIVGGAEGIGTQTTQAERVETGVALKVTPQVNKAGEITMLIEPSVTNTKWSAYFSSSYVDPQTRSAKTTVSVRDGQTVIIGGLINTEDTKKLRKLPFLADIPFLGNLFRKQDDSSTDKELIIFITPHLVTEGEEPKGLALNEALGKDGDLAWEYERFGLKEEAVEELLDRLEE